MESKSNKMKINKNPYIKIKNRKIGPDYPPVVIVELGINHKGSLEVAKKLVDAAARSGAEIIKHQTHVPEDEMSLEAKKIVPRNANKNIYDLIKDCMLSKVEEKALKLYVEKKGIIYISTPFSRQASNNLFSINVPAFKIGSGECNNYPLIKHISKMKKPIILSTGMNDVNSIKKSVKILLSNKIKFALLHCTNLYPTLPNQMRLNGIQELKKRFPKAVIGYSDHSGNNLSSLTAVALGACIIEKHFTIDSIKAGPDISSSINEKNLKNLIKDLYEIYISKKGGIKPIKAEKSTANFAFASVVAIKDIEKGEKFSNKNLWVKRPGNGYFLADKLESIYGRRCKCSVKKNTQLKKKNVF